MKPLLLAAIVLLAVAAGIGIASATPHDIKLGGLNYWAYTGDPTTPTDSTCDAGGPRSDRTFVFLNADVAVVRIGGFQGYAERSGVRNWAALDATFAAMDANNMQAIVPLGNEWNNCDGPSPQYVKGCSWYAPAGGYTQATFNGQAHVQSYRDYVAAFATRYASEPAIKYVELMNEPRGDQGGACGADVKTWAADVAGLIHSIAPAMQVSMGGDGDGWNYADVNGLADINVLTYHDYAHATEAVPTRIAGEISTAISLGKPVYNGENGIDCNDDGIGCPSPCDETAAANLMKAKAQAQFAAGASLYMAWAYNHTQNVGSCSYDFGPSSPRLAIIFPLNDRDGDGCGDVRELGTDWHTGGQRDINNPSDFMDVFRPVLGSGGPYTKDKAITTGDYIAILAYVGTSSANPNTPNSNGWTYGSDWNANGIPDGQEYDNSPAPDTSKPWAPGPPNGAVTIGDVITEKNGTGTNCT